MVARFCRFYPAYRVDSVLSMLASQFFALYEAMPRIDAEEEAKALTIQHAAHPDRRLKELTSRIRGTQQPDLASALAAGHAQHEDTEGEIAAFRAKQKEAAERLKQERHAWNTQKNKPPST